MMRIVSLLPSATEIICALGLQDQLVGVTHECDFPAFVNDLPKVTRSLIPLDASSSQIDEMVREQLRSHEALYTLDYPVLERLQPDLLITQTLCDVCAVSEQEVSAAACSLPGRPRVVNLEPMCLADVMNCICQVGDAAGVSRTAREVVDALEARVAQVARSTEHLDHPRVVLLEWIDPPFSSGHWSPELVRIAGGREGIGREGEKSRSVLWEEIVRFDPQTLLIACCGFTVERTMQDVPLLARFPGFSDLACVKSGKVFVVDGNAYFNRPGPRLVDGLEIIAHAIHPDAIPLPVSLIPARRLGSQDFNRVMERLTKVEDSGYHWA